MIRNVVDTTTENLQNQRQVTDTSILELEREVQKACDRFMALFKGIDKKGIQLEQYVRYLQMQYHLTKGVQETFLSIAAHQETRKYKSLRKFLVNFGYEEEMHFLLAQHDLKELNHDIGDCPFVVELWWAYQKYVISWKPIERLGATAVLENIGNFAAPLIKKLMSEASYLNKGNTTFVQVHMHEDLPHGDQILEAYKSVKWSQNHLKQLIKGAENASFLYIKLIFDWILSGDTKIKEI